MPRVTLSIPNDFKRQLDNHSEVKWSEVFRSIIKKKIEQLKKFEKLVEEGKI